ncbi:MAG: hypothetical protein QMD14_02330 [Candidatus Aenigmarchaeota archaeon]|nr:hypothetical protein [Candidatus Aenigmarchaeota archaeon]
MNIKKIKKIREGEFKSLLKNVPVAGDEEGIIKIYDRRFNLMGAEYWTAGFFNILDKIMKKGAVGILYNSGYEIGKIHFNWLKGIGIAAEEEFIGKYLGLLKFCGYGNINIASFDENRVVIVAESSPDGIEYKHIYKKKRKVCHYLKGILDGFLSSLLKKELTSEETKCVAAGDKCCEFVAKVK